MSENNDGWTNVKPEFWNPKEAGDQIEGIYRGEKHDVGKHKSKAYSVKLKNGKLMNAFGSEVLDDLMLGVEVGDELKIVYQGKDADKNYKKFDVFNRHPQEEN